MKKIIFLICLLFIFGACKHQQKTVVEDDAPKPLILVSKDPKGVFENWLAEATGSHQFECFHMYDISDMDSVRMMLRRSDGIIISGGEDVYPGLYGKEKDTVRCGPFDRRRDSLERIMIKFAFFNKIPLLAVCRGHQLMNVTKGGSLIIDIPEDTGSEFLHRDRRKAKRNKSTSVYHKISIKKESYLYAVVNTEKGKVYSNHHQAADIIAPGFSASSFAEDNIIESLEPTDTLNHPFILGVQWHPEAMKANNPLSGPIGRKFMYKVNQHFMID